METIFFIIFKYLRFSSFSEWWIQIKSKCFPKKELTEWINSSCICSSYQVQAQIKECYGVSYEISSVKKLLKSLGFRYKQLTLFPSKLDEEKQEQFVKDYENTQTTLAENDCVYFLDGVHPQHNTSTSRVQ